MKACVLQSLSLPSLTVDTCALLLQALPLLLAGVWVLVICTCNGIWGYARTAKTNFLGLTGIKITALACCTAITGLCISIMAFTPLLSKWTQSAMVGKSLKEKVRQPPDSMMMGCENCRLLS